MLISHVGLGITMPRVGRVQEMITSNIPLLPFIIADGERWQDQPFYAQYSNPDIVLNLPEGYVRSSFDVTLTQEENMLNGPVVVSAASVVSPGEHLSMRLEATATKAGAPDLSWDVTIGGQGVHVALAALPGVFAVDLVQGEDALFVPWGALFEPSVEGRALGNITATLTGAPVGVTVLTGGLHFDPGVLALQAGTTFTLVAENDNPAVSEPKNISVSLGQNIVEMTVPLTIAQGYAGGQLLELTNRDAAQDLSNWSGSLATDYVIFGAYEDGVSIAPLATQALLKVGSQYQTTASLWADGTGPSLGGTPKLTVMSDVMVVLDWLSVVDAKNDGSQWNLIVDAGPPDAMVVRGLEIDGRPLKGGVTVGDLRVADAALFETHIAPAPTYVVGAQPGDMMQLYEPVVVGPHDAPVTCVTHVLRDGLVVETALGDTRQLAAADDEALLSTQTTHAAVNANNSPLITTSLEAAVDIVTELPPYATRTFNTDGNGALRFAVPAGLTGYTMGGYAERPTSDSLLFRTQSGQMQLDSTGRLRVLVYDGMGVLAGNFIVNDVMDATGLTHVVFKADLSTNPMTGALYKNGVQVPITNFAPESHNGEVQSGSDFWLLMQDLTTKRYMGDFQEIFFDQGLGIDPATVFGTADPATLNPTYLLGGSGQRALPIGSSETPNMNAAEHNGTGTLVFDAAVTAGNEPFSEVV